MKRKLSKRAKLYIANGVCFLILVFCTLYMWIVGDSGIHYSPTDTIPMYVILQCAFTFFSLIVYYLSIIADAFSHKNRKKEEDKAASKNGDKNSDTQK